MNKIVAHRYWWFALSLLLILPGLVFLMIPGIGLRPSIDFAGGSMWEINLPKAQASDIHTEDIREIFAQNGLENAVVQMSEAKLPDGSTVPSAIIRSKSLDANNAEKQQQDILAALSAKYGEAQREQMQSVGATVSQESTRSAVLAVIGAMAVILVYLTIAFRKAPHPIRYGTCAILAMAHDVLVVLGSASILGYFVGLEVDSLFLTALLTIISFSVHDTIVVFDRVRENLAHRRSGESFEEVVNHSIVQTLPRSINTQLTSMFTLTALLMFGGASIRNFVIILLIGLISGTYSSIFNAAQLLVVWENYEWRNWFRGNRSSETASA
ncbi:protein translocase subunit SecF [Chloroflexia bacterium SDU3-3]|nr:protein translocase subunit SecF [Chloroflexia bacterium SDU3-3]